MAEGLQLALARYDILDRGGADRTDQLILEISRADIGGVAEHAPEPAFLAGVAQADDVLALVLRRGSADRLRAADRHDLDALGGEITAELRRDCLDRDAVGDAFDEDDGHARKLA